VLSRLFAKSRERTGVKLQLTDYHKRSRSLAAQIFYAKKAKKQVLYPELILMAKRVITQSEKATDQLQRRGGELALSQHWVDQVVDYRTLLERVIDQAERSVLKREKVPASQKIISLFEPHTDIIKEARKIEYGHKTTLATYKNGLITTLMNEQGNPMDVERFMPVIGTHQSL
jgi:IS5 family transposase